MVCLIVSIKKKPNKSYPKISVKNKKITHPKRGKWLKYKKYKNIKGH